MRKGGWGWGRAKNWQQRLPPMHSPQGWRKCGGGRVSDVQGHRCGGRARDGLGGKGGVGAARPANSQPAAILF